MTGAASGILVLQNDYSSDFAKNLQWRSTSINRAGVLELRRKKVIIYETLCFDFVVQLYHSKTNKIYIIGLP